MKIILFRSNNIFDSRVNKYHNYYERAGIDYTIVGWDRAGKGWGRNMIFSSTVQVKMWVAFKLSRTT